MRYRRFFLTICLFAFMVPFFPVESRVEVGEVDFPGWPSRFEGRELKEIRLSDREKRFEEDFPGRIAKFTDGEREYILRWVVSSTRKLHPSSDCFRGAGYSIRPLPIFIDDKGDSWGALSAEKGDDVLMVKERIYNAEGQTWSDVSAWYWAAILGKTRGPWWAMTVVEVTSD